MTSATSANLMPEQDVITDIINEYEIERGKSIFKNLKIPITVTKCSQNGHKTLENVQKLDDLSHFFNEQN